ncbi:hypothetical protein [Paraburkholderia sp. BL21I4N1]|uniref:hypothetical protein n=1 Tax=Paraburkholderia sp. BL21I4N1 TaxID=1938801 RepID=UPI0011B1DA20|nr:hypothetical protein [Paraburkholderia sp. BL21I4N1]
MRKALAFLILATPMINAYAGYNFVVPARSIERIGVGRMEYIPGPNAESVEPFATAHEFCMQAATSALIQFDDVLRASARSAFPKSPVSSPQLPALKWAYATVLPLPAPFTSYRFPQNQCVRGYDAFKPALVALPTVEHLYSGVETCAMMHGYDHVDRHERCVEAIAEHLEQ